MTRVNWTDVAPRDGLQNISEPVSTEAKIRLVRGLLDAGAPQVEATAFVSPRWVPQMADAAEVLAGLGGDLSRIRVLVPNSRGLDLALEHGIHRVLVTIGATDAFNRRNVNRDVAQSLADIHEMVPRAGAAGCAVDVAISVSYGCPFSGRVDPERVVDLAAQLVDAGCDEIGIADTIGVATPSAVAALTVALRDRGIPEKRLAAHFHDTRGLGVANVLSAFAAGVTRFDGSVGGVGGCPFAPRSTGNVASEDCLQALSSAGAETGADLAAYCAVAARLASDLGHDLPGKLYRAGIWSGRPMESKEGA